MLCKIRLYKSLSNNFNKADVRVIALYRPFSVYKNRRLAKFLKNYLFYQNRIKCHFNVSLIHN